MDIIIDNFALFAPLLIVQFGLIIVAIIDWIKMDQTNGPKLLWLIIILFISIIGPIAYFIFGRRNS